MRISIRQNDSGYHNYLHLRAHLQRTIVRLNGEIQTAAITADDEAGMVVRLQLPLKFDQERATFKDEVLHGKVEIEVQPEMML